MDPQVRKGLIGRDIGYLEVMACNKSDMALALVMDCVI